MSQSIPPPPIQTASHEGYLSEESKKKFTITAGILGAAFFFLQMFVPFIVMMLIMAPTMFFTTFKVTQYDLEGAVEHDGSLYFFAEEMEIRNGKSSTSLMRLDLADIPETELIVNKNPFMKMFDSSDDEEIEPEAVTGITGDSPRLLAGGERLLLISQSRMWELQGNALVETASYPTLGNISRPFYYFESPAVIEGRPKGLSLAVFGDGEWTKAPIFLEKERDFHNAECAVQVVNIGDTNHLFMQMGKTLFHRNGLPLDKAESDLEEWKSVGAVGHNWSSFALDGEPTVISIGENGVKRFIFDGVRWSRKSYASSLNKYSHDLVPIPSDGSLKIATNRFTQSMRIYSVSGDDLVLNARFGDGFPFPKFFMPMMFVPHIINIIFPVLLAVILSGLMLKHRVSVHTHAGKTVQFASLTRRALAQIVDGMILFVGMIPVSLSYMNMFDFMENDSEPTVFFVVMFAGMAFTFVWALILLFTFSFTEGKWGATPGKWLMGIRVVGTDLLPCGFGRALLRNFLKVVDGFFNFLVGILIVTFTKDWQRVGDMAARTIVIRPANRR
jgi:uncharacterized RDD family membrane protein YckC